MVVPAAGSPVPAEHRVMRLPVPPKDFTPEGWRPTYQELAPTDEDRRDAEANGCPVRVSVWDSTLTSAAEARAFRGRTVLVLDAQVESVVTAGATAVVYDPLASPDAERPGAAGHAGVEGLERARGHGKLEWRARLQAIADCFSLVRAT